MEELQDLVNRVKVSSLLNARKTEVMKICKNNLNGEAEQIIVDNNERIENVDEFVYLGALITNNYDDTKEIRRRSCIARNVMVSLTKKWKDRQGYYHQNKGKAPPIIGFYHSQLWLGKLGFKIIDKKKIEAFELWCYRLLLRISFIEKRQTNGYWKRWR